MRMFVITTPAVTSRRSGCSRPSASVRSSVTLRLHRLSSAKVGWTSTSDPMDLNQDRPGHREAARPYLCAVGWSVGTWINSRNRVRRSTRVPMAERFPAPAMPPPALGGACEVNVGGVDGLVDRLGAQLPFGLVRKPLPQLVGHLLGAPPLSQQLCHDRAQLLVDSQPPWARSGGAPCRQPVGQCRAGSARRDRCFGPARGGPSTGYGGSPRRSRAASSSPGAGPRSPSTRASTGTWDAVPGAGWEYAQADSAPAAHPCCGPCAHTASVSPSAG